MNIDELLDIQYNQLPSRVERWTYEGSGWTIDLILIQQLVISEIAPCEGLPKELRTPMKGQINVQNEDNEWFRWCLVKWLNTVNKKPAKIRNVAKEFSKQRNYKGVKFTVHKKTMEKQKNKIMFSLMYLVMKMKYHAVFMLQNKLLKNILIYYYY